MSSIDSQELKGLSETVDDDGQKACVGVRQIYIWRFIEVIQRLGLWDDGTLVQDNTIERCIPHIRVGIFGVAAHFRVGGGNPQAPKRHFYFRNGSVTNWSLSSHAWYMLQHSINGRLPRNGFSPVDRPYLESFAEAQIKQGVASTAQLWLTLMYAGISGIATPHTSGDAWTLYNFGRGPYLAHTPNYVMDTWELSPGVFYSDEDRRAHVEQYARAWIPWPLHFGQRYFVTNDAPEITGLETGDPFYASAATQRHLEMMNALREFEVAQDIQDQYLLIAEILWPNCFWRPGSRDSFDHRAFAE